MIDTFDGFPFFRVFAVDRLMEEKRHIFLPFFRICAEAVSRGWRENAMERVKKYIGSAVNLDHIKDAECLKDLGFTCRYLPDPPEDFDEFEFAADLGGLRNVGLMVTIELMVIKRIFFGLISPDNPDIVSGLTEVQVQDIFDQSGDTLFRFLDYITEQSR
ncbi:MAG: hypothetical protein JRF64_00045 [Deltaproteobacteria bacterium]|nr:hypothetical protein [Deltaproteobacteria bacterium]